MPMASVMLSTVSTGGQQEASGNAAEPAHVLASAELTSTSLISETIMVADIFSGTTRHYRLRRFHRQLSGITPVDVNGDADPRRGLAVWWWTWLSCDVRWTTQAEAEVRLGSNAKRITRATRSS